MADEGWTVRGGAFSKANVPVEPNVPAQQQPRQQSEFPSPGFVLGLLVVFAFRMFAWNSHLSSEVSKLRGDLQSLTATFNRNVEAHNQQIYLGR